MDAIDYLLKEHDSHRELLNKIETDQSHFTEFRSELVHHINMEEAILYPSLMKVKELEEIVRSAWDEHSNCMELVQELDKINPADKLWYVKFKALKEILITHLADEERDLFPRVKKLASTAFLYEVGEQMRIQKKLTNTDDILYPDEPGSHENPRSADK